MKKLNKEPSFNNSGLNSPITEFALALSAVNEDYLIPSGTAITIGPNLAITAKHVIENYIEVFHRKIPLSDFTSIFSMFAFQILNNGEKGALWEVRKITLSSYTDIAFLYLLPCSKEANDYVWRLPKIDLLPPNIGTRIHCFGYPKSEIVESKVSLREDGTKHIEVTWLDSPSTSTGEVIELHHNKRDSVMLNFPCFRTNARFDPGMSGGPVFNDDGQLCGTICSGFEGSQDNYVAMLWPSMATLIDFPILEKNTKYPVFDLVKSGLIKAKNFEFLTIQNGSISLKYPDIKS